jgi:hypothetical protein
VFGESDAISFFGSLQAKDKLPIAISNAVSYISLFFIDYVRAFLGIIFEKEV